MNFIIQSRTPKRKGGAGFFACSPSKKFSLTALSSQERAVAVCGRSPPIPSAAGRSTVSTLGLPIGGKKENRRSLGKGHASENHLFPFGKFRYMGVYFR